MIAFRLFMFFTTLSSLWGENACCCCEKRGWQHRIAMSGGKQLHIKGKLFAYKASLFASLDAGLSCNACPVEGQ
jgi:hypothetical protein